MFYLVWQITIYQYQILKKWTPKSRFFAKKSIFERIKYANMQKNEAFMHFFLHNYLILVRSTGIEDADPPKKSFVYKAFTNWTPKWTPKIFEDLSNNFLPNTIWLYFTLDVDFFDFLQNPTNTRTQAQVCDKAFYHYCRNEDSLTGKGLGGKEKLKSKIDGKSIWIS